MLLVQVTLKVLNIWMLFLYADWIDCLQSTADSIVNHTWGLIIWSNGLRGEMKVFIIPYFI